MADPWTAAWEEAEATNPPVLVYHTLELQHPAFVDEAHVSFVVRVVQGATSDQTFTIEDGATYNGGEDVEFTAVEFSAEMPEVAEAQVPQCKLTIDGVGDEIVPYLEDATGFRADMVIVYRQYRSDDTSEPCYGPVQFVMRGITLQGASLSGIATLDDLSNQVFPSKVYTYDKYPGLLNGS